MMTEAGDETLCNRFQQKLGGELLESVSRSFYLTLKALPSEVRGTVSLGYLLARATDTVADCGEVTIEKRVVVLEGMAGAIGGEEWACAEAWEEWGIEKEGERELLGQFGECLGWLGAVKEHQRDAIRKVLGTIVETQIKDAEGWVPGTAEELDGYTYGVAGCVGEFWTEVCEGDLSGFRRDGVSEAEMREWGIRFGKGLQLVNILRDLAEDLKNGRCYLPCEAKPEAMMAEAREWMEKCDGHLEAGLRYLQGIGHRRACVATALPLMLGVKTLGRLKTASWAELEARVKVTRGDVAGVTARCALVGNHPKRLEKMYESLKCLV